MVFINIDCEAEELLCVIKGKKTQAEIKIAGRNVNNLRQADDTTLMAESKEEQKKPLDESERGG